MYAPNQDDPEFFESLMTQVEKFSPDYKIIAGDFNLAIDRVMDRRGTCNNDRSALWLQHYFEGQEMVDSWRHFKPSEPGYTCRKTRPTPTFSRLDYIFITEAALQFITKVDLVSGFHTDHTIVKLVLEVYRAPKGPGYWKFNNAVLKDIDYLARINELIDRELQSNSNLTAKQLWDVLKLTIRTSTLQFACYRQKSNKNKLKVLERQLRKLEVELDIPSPILGGTEEQI